MAALQAVGNGNYPGGLKMKELVKNFITDSEKEKIIESVRNVEKKTSGEIVPMIVSTSYSYPMSDIIGGLTISLPLSIVAAYFIGPLMSLGTQNLWVFLGIESVLFLFFYVIVKNILWLKRFFISNNEINEEVNEAAVTAFFTNGLYKTRDETGVLIFISVFERKVWVLADRGINEKVDSSQWEEIVNMIIAGIKQKKQCESICSAIERVGEILESHFPCKKDDTDELDNLII